MHTVSQHLCVWQLAGAVACWVHVAVPLVCAAGPGPPNSHAKGADLSPPPATYGSSTACISVEHL